MKSLRILCWARQSGKTTEVRKFLENHKGAVAISCTMQRAMYLSENRTESVCFTELDKWVGTKDIAIDEVDYIDWWLVKYILEHTDNVLIAGTPRQRHGPKDFSNFSRLFELYPKKFEYRESLLSEEQKKEFKKTLTKEQYDVDILGKMIPPKSSKRGKKK